MIPESVVVVAIVFSQCCLVARLVMLKKMIGIQIRAYLWKIWLNVMLISCISAILSLLLRSSVNETFLSFVYSTFTCLVSTIITVMFIGCTAKERIWIWGKVKYICRKLK